MKENTLVKKNRKVSRCRKTERWDPLGFFNIHSVAKHQKIEGGHFGEKNFEKSHNAEKVSRGIVYCAEKRNNSFG